MVGKVAPEIEAELRRPDIMYLTARAIVDAEDRASLADDVPLAVGLDPDQVAAESLNTGLGGALRGGLRR